MDKLKKVRSTIRAKFTRLQTFSESIDSDNPPSSEELINRLEYLETCWLDYNTNLHLIIADLDENDIEPEETDFSEKEAKYFELKTNLQKYKQESD